MIGGGYVGLELSQAMRRFGSKVSLVDRNDRLIHREDDDVTEALQQLFEDEGSDLALNARIKRVSGESGRCEDRYRTRRKADPFRGQSSARCNGPRPEHWGNRP